MAASTKTRLAAAVAGAATVVLLGGGGLLTATAAPSRDGAPPPTPTIAWEACETTLPGVDVGAYECATVDVPTDYDRPHGRTTQIAVTRLPATDPERRIGSVLTNFGGPGGPGVDTLHQVGELMFAPEVRERFDVVSFDPRGVGRSDPVTCFPTAAQEEAFFARLPGFPVTPEEERRTIAGFTVTAAGCQLISGDRLAHSSTANVARDMDVLRAALGDEALTYVGYSYGTILGATYSALFPDSVRALVLDGPIDPVAWSGVGSPEPIGVRVRQAHGATQTFGEFTRLCTEVGPGGCALAGLGDPAELTEEVLQALQDEPVEVPIGGGEPFLVTYQDAVGLLFSGMYNTADWPAVAATFAELAVRNGVTDPVPQARQQTPSLDELLRRLGLVEDYPSLGGAVASLCMDTHNPLPLWRYPALADAHDAQYPHFGRLRGWLGAQCAPILLRDHDAYTGPWEQSVEQPVLVVGTRFDPATPYEFVEPFAAHYPDARVLTVEGWGHTTLGRSTCADAAIARYLVSGEAQDSATCAQDLTPFTAGPLAQPLPAPPGPVRWPF